MHDNLTRNPGGLTYEDYCALPDDGQRYEILDGELFVSPSPIPLHQLITGNLFAELRSYIRPNKLGRLFAAPLDILLSKHNIVEPDIVFVSNAKSSVMTDKNVQGAPDLLIEVLSPSSRKRDLQDKRRIYGEWGVDWYWIVDPQSGTLVELQRIDKAFVEVAHFTRRTTFSPKLFPGLSIDMNELWEH